jgi:hypothetical protein
MKQSRALGYGPGLFVVPQFADGANQKPPSSARGSLVNHEHSNGFRWSKLLALAPGAERSRCGLFGLLGHLWRCKRSVDQSGAQVEAAVDAFPLLARLNDLPTVG